MESPKTIAALVDLASNEYHSLVDGYKGTDKKFKKKMFDKVIATMQGLYGEKLGIYSISQMKNWFNHFRPKKVHTVEQIVPTTTVGVQIALFA
jgi:UDP-glucose 6-dehydrogenase